MRNRRFAARWMNASLVIFGFLVGAKLLFFATFVILALIFLKLAV